MIDPAQTANQTSPAIDAGSIVRYDGQVWLVGETAIRAGEGLVARLWPRQIKTARDGREYVAPRDGVFGREGDIWLPVAACELIEGARE